jgi:hypothetical protein
MVLLTVSLTALRAAEVSLIPFELEDYQKNIYSNAIWGESNILMFLSNREGTKYNDGYVWTTPVTEFIRESGLAEKTVVVSVADVRGVPRLAQGFVRKLFEPDESDPVGLTLLDWEGEFFAAYDLDADGYHLLVFDREHRLVFQDVVLEFDRGQLHTILVSLGEL